MKMRIHACKMCAAFSFWTESESWGVKFIHVLLSLNPSHVLYFVSEKRRIIKFLAWIRVTFNPIPQSQGSQHHEFVVCRDILLSISRCLLSKHHLCVHLLQRSCSIAYLRRWSIISCCSFWWKPEHPGKRWPVPSAQPSDWPQFERS